MKLLDYKEAAAYLRCSPLTLRKKVSQGVIAHLKPFGPNSRVYFDQADLDRLLEDSRVEATS